MPSKDSMSPSIQEVIQNWMTARHKTLALAESCTGGRIVASLTALPGASKYLLGSIVTYSNEFKERLLGVSHQILEKHGAVSAEVTQEMLKGIFYSTKADYGLASSGNA